MTKGRVVVAMSGGVDSSVTAALLKEQGYDVVAITMQLWNHGEEGESRFDSCCSLSDVNDARMVAHRLGVPHYVVNYESQFRQGVVDYFASEYAAGRTPNPCVMCNSKLKFDHLVDRAEALGADKVATGHYARLERTDDDVVALRQAKDSRKDQSYFLFDMRQDNLRRAMFPLGDYTKAEVREIAGRYDLPTAAKHESQEICFVSEGRYSDFLERHYPNLTAGTEGEIVDADGSVLGRHEGIHRYTVGQRKGLGNLKTNRPRYVKEIDPETNRIVVDDAENLKVASFAVDAVNWLVPEAELNEERILNVMVRYRAKTLPCRIQWTGEGGRIEVLLSEPARWVTPGQAAVFYDEDRVIGGGFISTSKKPADPSRRVREAVGSASADLR